MAVQVIRNRDLVRRPWKNGGGTTVEIVASPPGSGLDDFDWRISMADVASSGPFSVFEGIDRTLALIDGEAIDIDVDGVPHRLDAVSRLLSFPGDASTRASLPYGAIRDLNVMTRRDRILHRMRIAPAGDRATPAPCTILAIVALDGAATVEVDGRAYDCDRFDLVLCEPAPARVRATVATIEIALRSISSPA